MTIAATNSDMWCLIELSLGRILLSKTFMIWYLELKSLAHPRIPLQVMHQSHRNPVVSQYFCLFLTFILHMNRSDPIYIRAPAGMST
jgi:lipid-A-disaccharide synthase-like uncharacterized protein